MKIHSSSMGATGGNFRVARYPSRIRFDRNVNEFGPVCSGTESLMHAMPPRITRNSDRPRASNRTMVDIQIPGPLAKF